MISEDNCCLTEESNLKKCEEQAEHSTFFPPLYIQRYLKVSKFVEENEDNIKKIVDVGCNNLALFRYLKNHSNVQEIVLIDIDEQLLEDNIWKVKTLPYDYLCKRLKPLSVYVISADAKIPNYNLPNVDLLTMIEVIEHLYEDELPSLIFNVFQAIRPKYIYVSTPNAEYNQFFMNFKPGQFRHPDHKFEWDSTQFKKWALSIATEYFYDIEFDGCGTNDDGLFCTQIAIFCRQDAMKPISVQNCSDEENAMKILYKEDFPYNQETEEEKMKNKILVSFQSLFKSLMECMRNWDMESEHIFYKPIDSSSKFNKECNTLSDKETSFSDLDINKTSLLFTLKMVDENIKSKMVENICYYSYSEDSVSFLVESFCNWLEEQHQLEFLRYILDGSVQFKQNGEQNYLSVLMHEDESECDNSD